ncbi:GyrI-like domain-containing protein [Bdellovibrio sp. 22V]|uniref:GyrI-like domain-containing protein n=1 Tax=Bdellovibrio TaxID=958 RepID=UPI00254392F7|nr:GyrI-like domain-containing protein [Bdellovibrio sp. 22V]WII72272.1 GyrI-like domain-containing protein [Bdellovibrio sp. 22V]
MKYVLLFIGVMLISFGVFLATYLGAFKGVDISESSQGPFKTVFIEHVGPYHKVNKVIEQVEKYMQSQGAPCGRTFGEYLDDPQTVEEARLRSKVGCIVETVPANLPENLHAGEIPAKKYVVAVFTGSPGIGPLKVYPRVNDYMLERNLKQEGAVIEIYEIHSITEKSAMTTTYLFPVQ